MNDLTTSPAADLLAEIKYLNNKKSHPQVNWATNEEKVVLIAVELDRRCEEAGIYLENGRFLYADMEYEYIDDDGYGNISWGRAFVPEVAAKEQHDLEAWLLLKGGNG